MPLDINPPPIAKLNPQFILGEIVDNIQDLADEHPNVDVGLLRKVLSAVRKRESDPENTIREYLNAFIGTNSLQRTLAQLDKDTQSKIQAFAKGKSAAKVTAAKGFWPKPSLTSQHRFRFLDFFHRLVHHHHHDADLASFKASPGLPLVYEDKAESQVMEVSGNAQDWRFLRPTTEPD